MYQFFLNVLEGVENESLRSINNSRKKFTKNHQALQIDDFGAKKQRIQRTVAEIMSKSVVSHRYGRVLHHMTNYFRPSIMLELGTSLGFGSLYLKSGMPDAHLFTIEGAAEVQQLAQQLFYQSEQKGIDSILGNFDTALPKILSNINQLDLAYIDGNHRKDPTLRYFELLKQKCHEKSVLIFDDIYWSTEMTEAWELIKKDNDVRLTIDIYRMGFVFFRSENLAKEHFTLRY